MVGMVPELAEVSWWERPVLLSLAAALAAGGLIGAERERHGRAAGLRTTLLVCLAACVAMVLSREVGRGWSTLTWSPDPARLAAGVLSGMGFLGAGVIVREHTHLIRGVTTAATLWFATIIGLAFGAQLFLLGWAATVLALVILYVVPFLEKGIENDWYSDLEVVVAAEGCQLEEIRSELEKQRIFVKEVDWSEDFENGERVFHLHLKYGKGMRQILPGLVVKDLSKLAGIKRVHWKA